MPQRRSEKDVKRLQDRRATDAVLSRGQLRQQPLTKDFDAAAGESTLGATVIDRIANMAAKGEITPEEAMAIIQKKMSLTEATGKQ